MARRQAGQIPWLVTTPFFAEARQNGVSRQFIFEINAPHQAQTFTIFMDFLHVFLTSAGLFLQMDTPPPLPVCLFYVRMMAHVLILFYPEKRPEWTRNVYSPPNLTFS